LLDLIACPYLDFSVRQQLLLALTANLSAFGSFDSVGLVQEIQANPWFVNWAQIDLLNHLRKKELSAVY